MWILATDIDNTLTGDLPALRRLSEKLQALREQEELFLILSTGRRLAQVLAGFVGESLPQADAIVSQVGTEIYLPPFDEEMKPLPAWQEKQRACFSRRRALQFLQGIEGLQMQPKRYNTPLKVSAYLHHTPDPEEAAAHVRQRVRTADRNCYQVVWSSGMHLDIIPALAGKGNAIHFLLNYLNLSSQRVIVAGDSGNDRSMFAAFPRGIVVANAQPELLQLRATASPDHYFAREKFAAGVSEGLCHFDVF